MPVEIVESLASLSGNKNQLKKICRYTNVMAPSTILEKLWDFPSFHFRYLALTYENLSLKGGAGWSP